MERRNFIKAAVGLAAAGYLPVFAGADEAVAVAQPFAPSPEQGWRVFELVAKLELENASGATQVWIPLPSVYAAEWIKPMGNLWQGNATEMQAKADPTYQAQMLHAVWDGKQTDKPMLEVVSRFAVRDRAVDLGKPGDVPDLGADERKLFTSPTRLLPTDGIVLETANKIVAGKTTDVDKARAIYEWIVENTVRDPKTEGCGIGDIKFMLESGNLKGKCADLNALYVGLARAAGLPARDVYGIRVADSRFGYKSIGKSGNVSKGQHCRAEVFLSGFGWVPVDPADVRKVILEENKDQQLTLDDPKVKAVREKLFGAWETNWLAYNVAHDIQLPGSSGDPVTFLMYPQGETGGKRLNSIKPDEFKYELTSREVISSQVAATA